MRRLYPVFSIQRSVQNTRTEEEMMLNVSLEGFLQRIESDQILPGSLAEADTSHHPGWGWRELESGCRLGWVLPEPRQKAAHCLSCPGSNVNTSVISSPELKPSVLCQESRAQLGFIIVPNLVLVIKEAILTRQNSKILSILIKLAELLFSIVVLIFFAFQDLFYSIQFLSRNIFTICNYFCG